MRRLRYSPIKLQEEISFKTVVRSMKYSIAVWSTGLSVLIDAIDTLYTAGRQNLNPRSVIKT